MAGESADFAKSVFNATVDAAIAALDTSEELARGFFEPLKGKSATFLLSDRASNLSFARTLAALVSATGRTCTVFDLDAFYSSNADVIFGGPRGPPPGKVAIRVPAPASKVEDEFPMLFSSGPSLVIIDTLNTFFHLLSSDEGAFRSRKFSFAIASLSFATKSAGSEAILTMYRREPPSRRGQGRSMSSYSDLVVGVEKNGDGLVLRCEKGDAWGGRDFSIRIP